MTLEQQIHDSAQQFADAYNRGDLATIVELYDNDALILSPECSIETGTEAVKTCYQEAINLGWKNFKQTTVEIKLADKLAYHVGQYTIDSPEVDGKSEQAKGKYIDVYKLHDDGIWKIHVTAFNYDHPITQQNTQY